MRRAARCCLLRLLIDGCGIVDAAIGDEACAPLHVAAEREGVACGFARDVRDRVPERDDRDGRAVVDPGEGIPCGVGSRDGRATPATHAEPREHDVVGVKAGWLLSVVLAVFWM